jgi:hypothetical protein
LDGPGTPLLADGKHACCSSELDQVPITAAMFGTKQADHLLLPRLGLANHTCAPPLAIKIGSYSDVLDMVFEFGGEEKHIKICHRPFGVEFGKTQAGCAEVARVQHQSYAEQLGVEVGWIVRSVDGEDVSNKQFDQIQRCVKNRFIHLPEEPPPCQ